ncbi:hypothetical protein TWF694_000393 [Orbilia ellipsospora]|uniref:BTB domain-containing protein n=1 Tax=Orbilia ellipsospora TaxID=2528407 RepID=A0AAV9XNJ5_9PEZI
MDNYYLAKALKSPIIKIIISGADSESELCRSSVYYVHKDILTTFSPYFAQIVHSNASSPPVGEIFLDSPLDTPKALDVFLHFAYTGSLDYKNYAPDASQLLDYANVYNFASKILVPRLKEHALNLAQTYLQQSLDIFQSKSSTGHDDSPEMLFEKRTEFVKTWWRVVETIYARPINSAIRFECPGLAIHGAQALQNRFDRLQARFKAKNFDLFKYLLVTISYTDWDMIEYDTSEFNRIKTLNPEYEYDISAFSNLQHMKLKLEVEILCNAGTEIGMNGG